MNRRFENKVCIVTGGGSGIGRATCERFASEGGRVAVMGRNVAHVEQTVDALRKSGAEAISCIADVGNPDDIQNAIRKVVDAWQQIHVVVNNAGMMTFQNVVDLSLNDWQRVIQVNLTSVFLMSKFALPHMPAHSAIINISSVHAHETEAGVAPYAASKGGMEAFSRVLAMECEERKVRVNCVAPGSVNTPMLWNNPNVKSGRETVKCVGEPADIASVICFLASDEAHFVNATTVVVDGARLSTL